MAQEKQEGKMKALSSDERPVPLILRSEALDAHSLPPPAVGGVLQQRVLEEGNRNCHPFIHPTDLPGADAVPGSGLGSVHREIAKATEEHVVCPGGSMGARRVLVGEAMGA